MAAGKRGLDYYRPMTQPHRFIALAMLLGTACITSYAAQPKAGPVAPVRATTTPSEAELFYEVLLGEMTAASGEPATGYVFLLDAARKAGDPALFKRAIDLAVQARSGEAALAAALAWRDAQADSRDANRFVLRLLVELNRVDNTVEPLRRELALTPAPAKTGVLAAIPLLFSKLSDKPAAARAVEKALDKELAVAAYAPAALTTIGRMQALANNYPAALEKAERALALDPKNEEPALLALELMDRRVPSAENLVRRYLDQNPSAEFRLNHARVLIDLERFPEATQQMLQVTREKPALPEAWLILGTLQLQSGQQNVAETSLQTYLGLVKTAPASEIKTKGNTQAYLLLAQIAEKRKDFKGAEDWLAKIEDADALFSAQTRRASVLAAQGKLEEARAVIRQLPERKEGAARLKMLAEVQLLRDNRQYRAAYDLLVDAGNRSPDDTDLLYDQAMMADKLGDAITMERLLRQLIERKPAHYNAYNALGYAFADKGVRLAEAKTLVQKALEYAPADPFISDSLAWVEFKMGNKTEALRILETAFQAKPDAEIAAHLGEVLWSMGQKDRATSIWREGLALNAENETLLETLKRFRVKP